ncbi:MAG: hypothetical protein NTU47_04325 [Ignavibacteriales bacterium]|nr:hypothetical protein [Ignavibacteriales bacterium]
MSHTALSYISSNHIPSRTLISTNGSTGQGRHLHEVKKLVRLLARKSAQLPIYTRFQTISGYQTVPVMSVQVTGREIVARIENAEPLLITWEQLVGLVVFADDKGRPYFDANSAFMQEEIFELDETMELELAA